MILSTHIIQNTDVAPLLLDLPHAKQYQTLEEGGILPNRWADDR